MHYMIKSHLYILKPLLARLFSEKTSRYCHSPGGGGGGGGGVVQKLRHFLISLLLLKIFT